MTETTGRFALPMLVPGQAQKEMTHNEALALVDIALHPSVVAVGVDTPPPQPPIGACWIVGDSPEGAWAGHPGALAGWTAGGWRFLNPRDGMAVSVSQGGGTAQFGGGGWAIVTPDAGIVDPSGGDVVDLQARSAIAAILAVLRRRGVIVEEAL